MQFNKEVNTDKCKTLRIFLIYWYYFWGHVVSRPMLWFDFGWIYPYYNEWMGRSADYDIDGIIWKYVDKE